MAHHLARVHPAPAADRVGAQRLQALKELNLVTLLRQRFHGCPSNRTPPASRNATRARSRPVSAPASSDWNSAPSRSVSNCDARVSVGATKYPLVTARRM